MTTQYIYDMADTWNNAATTFTAIKLNATDTASAAGSLLMDLQVGGTSRFSVNKSGQIDAAWNGVQFLRLSAADYQVYNGANRNLIMGSNSQGLGLNPAWSVSWSSSSTDAFASRDTFLTRRAAANLRLGAANVGATTSTVTITIAAPGVVTWTGHGFSTGTPVVFTTTGALPTGITAGTTYYAVVVDANTFQIASSVANAIAAVPTVITTSGTQSGTHTGTRYNITQRLGMQSVTGVADRLGADLVIQGSQGTGTGAGGSIVFQVAPAGSSGTAQNALATALTIGSTKNAVFAADVTVSGFSDQGLTTINNKLALGGTADPGLWISGTAVQLQAGGTLGWSSVAGPQNTADVILRRDAANTLALRNGANAQTFRVYNTTDGTNSEFGSVRWDTNVLKIGVEAAGSGSASRNIEFAFGGTTRLTITATNGTTQSTGSFIAAAGFGFFMAGRSGIQSAANGVLSITNNAGTDFDRLQFGGTTSSFPALKRSSTTLQARLADDSAFASVQGKITTDTAYTAGDPTTTGYLVVYDSSGTAYKIPAVAV